MGRIEITEADRISEKVPGTSITTSLSVFDIPEHVFVRAIDDREMSLQFEYPGGEAIELRWENLKRVSISLAPRGRVEQVVVPIGRDLTLEQLLDKTAVMAEALDQLEDSAQESIERRSARCCAKAVRGHDTIIAIEAVRSMS